MDKIESALKEQLKNGIRIEIKINDYGILTKELYRKLWVEEIKLPHLAIRYSYKYNPKTKKVDVTSNYIYPDGKRSTHPVEHMSLTSAIKDLKTGVELAHRSTYSLGYIRWQDGSVESCMVIYHKK